MVERTHDIGRTGRSPGRHRPERTVLAQTWSRIAWAHWPVDPGEVTRILPAGLTPDTFDGCAWVGLVPFRMSDLRLPGLRSGLTSLAGVASFGEVNVRTYVRGPDGRTGVWFATLDADPWLAVATARVAFGLPYRVADTHVDLTSGDNSGQLAWTSVRRRDGARATLRVEPGDEQPRTAAPGLEHFLVERYSLYSWWHGRILRGALSHAPWRVRSAHLAGVDSGTVAASGIRVDGAPHVLVGEPVDVRVHPFRSLGRPPSGRTRGATGPLAGGRSQ